VLIARIDQIPRPKLLNVAEAVRRPKFGTSREAGLGLILLFLLGTWPLLLGLWLFPRV
jgi:hypothetical protein